VRKADRFDHEARHNDEVVVSKRQVKEPDHLVRGHQLEGQLPERDDHNHEQNTVGVEKLRELVVPRPPSHLELVNGRATSDP